LPFGAFYLSFLTPLLSSTFTAQQYWISPVWPVNTISIKDALKKMELRDHRGNAIPFSLQFTTCDENRLTGGEIITAEGVILARHKKRVSRSNQSSPAKAANEWDNGTRNLLFPNGEIRKCHIWLITQFNGQETHL
jgi:hypothetical protein